MQVTYQQAVRALCPTVDVGIDIHEMHRMRQTHVWRNRGGGRTVKRPPMYLNSTQASRRHGSAGHEGGGDLLILTSKLGCRAGIPMGRSFLRRMFRVYVKPAVRCDCVMIRALAGSGSKSRQRATPACKQLRCRMQVWRCCGYAWLHHTLCHEPRGTVSRARIPDRM